MPAITPNLWFDRNGEEAAEFYCSIFPNSRVVATTRYGDHGHGEPGTVMTIDLDLDGNRFTIINGGPQFTFDEAVSFLVNCADQAEIDHYWERLGDGARQVGPCGWLKDRFGLSWQIVPANWTEFILTTEPAALDRAMTKLFTMEKIDIAALYAAAAGDER